MDPGADFARLTFPWPQYPALSGLATGLVISVVISLVPLTVPFLALYLTGHGIS
jgi:hypothetical protein